MVRIVCGAFLIAAGLLGISGWYWKMALIGVGGYVLLLFTFAANQQIVRKKKKK